MKKDKLLFLNIPEGFVLGLAAGFSLWQLTSVFQEYFQKPVEAAAYSNAMSGLDYSPNKKVELVESDLRKQIAIWNMKLPKGFDFKLFTASLLEAETKFGIDYEILFAVAVIESGFQVQAESHKGAQGVFQFMPQTAEIVWPKLKKNLHLADPIQNFNAPEAVRDVRASTLMGAFYLADLKKIFGGQLHLALASYNVGPGALKKGIEEGKLLSSEYVFRVYDLANELRGLKTISTGV
jgi:soluble lytic murein transglycosylase-like protein